MNRKLLLLLFLGVFLINCSKSKVESKNDFPPRPDSSITTSGNKSPDNKTNRTKDKEDVIIKTPDSLEVPAGYYYTSGKKETAEPLVILIHQFQQSKEQWQQSFIDTLTAQGYKVLAYDIRGHGKSAKVKYDLTKLLEDPELAPNDIKGVVSWAKKQKGIDSARIAAIGTSIGGNLAFYAKMVLKIKTAVAISNGKETLEKYIGYDERMMSNRPQMTHTESVFLICGNKDGDSEAGQKFMMTNFLNDPKEMKVFDSDKHGKALLEEHLEIYNLILNWLNKNL